MNTDRIERMEKALRDCMEATEALNGELDRMEQLRETTTELFRYYGSEEWYRDREEKLPEGMAAGVLSEDLVYDAITELRDASFRMLETATDILKNRI